ncbi:MAG: diguanylate cyclase [Chromatiales bacterium]|nr:diguanylate cyclase [Gammaproteobacteria bacterium]MBW6477116.1 diguanylate cyclase [Chromatiales bacterium]
MVEWLLQRCCLLGIRQKVVIVLLIGLLIALSISGWLLLRDVEQDILKETNRRGAEMVDYLSQSLAYSMVGYDYHTIQLQLDQIIQSGSIMQVRVLSDRGNLMAEATHPSRPSVERAGFDGPVWLNQQHIGHIELELNIDPIVQQLAAQKAAIIKREIIVILLIALGEFMVLSWVIIRPLTQVSRALESNVDDSGLILREIPVHAKDEIGELAQRFNLVRAQLNVANEKLQGKVEATDKELQAAYEQLLAQSARLQDINDELERISLTDPLTGLGNRRAFDLDIENDVAMFKRHGDLGSLVMMDLDHFKRINDTYGHDVGDQVLVQFAHMLRVHIRETDSICRMGGEEFAIFLRRTDSNEAIATANNLRELTEMMAIEIGDELQIQITVSIGVASLSNERQLDTTMSLYKAADQAMYISKQRGRNQVTCYDQLKLLHTQRG